MAALNPTEPRHDVGFRTVTRHRRHHDEILRALLEDRVNAGWGLLSPR